MIFRAFLRFSFHIYLILWECLAAYCCARKSFVYPGGFPNKFGVTLAESAALPKGFGVLPDNLEGLPDKLQGHTGRSAYRPYGRGE